MGLSSLLRPRRASPVAHNRLPSRNLRILEGRIAEVQRDAGTSALEEVLLETARIRTSIDDTAFRLYGLEAHRSTVEDALKMVL